MHLRAVSAAARIGASLDPFTGEQIVVHKDSGETLHFDPSCVSLGEGGTTVVVLGLETVYLYRQCGACLRPYRFTERVERYGEAIELLHRARLLVQEGTGSEGLRTVRARQQAFASCRRAVRLVGETGAVKDVERCVSQIKRLAGEDGAGDVEDYLSWAAAMVVDPRRYFGELRKTDPERWLGRIEYAKGELRTGGWRGFAAACGASATEIEEYRSAVGEVRSSGGEVLVAVLDGEEEGDLLLWVSGRSGVERSGVWYGLVPAWTIGVANGLGARFSAVGEAGGEGLELVEMYAELAKVRPGNETLRAARRLVRARGGK